MRPFALSQPQSLSEATGLLAADGVRPVAGGTAVMLMMKTGVFQPDRLVSLRGLGPEFSQISIGNDGFLRIGAMATLRQLEQSADVSRAAPVVASAMQRLANIRVRNVATVGGTLAHADPHLDLPPILIALDARLTMAGPAGKRTLAVENLFRGYLETALENGELITQVAIPPQGARSSVYLKHTTRSADDWPALGIAASVQIENGSVSDIRVAIGAATDTPRRLPGVEATLSGKPLDAASIARAADTAASEAELRSDARGSAPYKRELVCVFMRRALERIANGGQV